MFSIQVLSWSWVRGICHVHQAAPSTLHMSSLAGMPSWGGNLWGLEISHWEARKDRTGRNKASQGFWLERSLQIMLFKEQDSVSLEDQSVHPTALNLEGFPGPVLCPVLSSYPVNYCLPKEGKGRSILQKAKLDFSFPHSRTWLNMGRTR